MENRTLINAIEGELRGVRVALNTAERYIGDLRSQLNDEEEERITPGGVEYVIIDSDSRSTEDGTRRARL